MDLQSREKWVEFSKAKDEMFKHTDIKQRRGTPSRRTTKRRARLNCLAHILSMVSYEEATPPPLKLARAPAPRRQLRAPAEVRPE